MAKSESTEAYTSEKPDEVSKEQAETMRDYAQNLDDKITHVVDYGDLKEK